jgi:hypothetical protein
LELCFGFELVGLGAVGGLGVEQHGLGLEEALAFGHELLLAALVPAALHDLEYRRTEAAAGALRLVLDVELFEGLVDTLAATASRSAGSSKWSR